MLKEATRFLGFLLIISLLSSTFGQGTDYSSTYGSTYGTSTYGNETNSTSKVYCAKGVVDLTKSTGTITIYTTILLGISIIFEIVIEKIEEAFEHRKHLLKILNAIFKELMIIGIIAAILFILHATKVTESFFYTFSEYEPESICPNNQKYVFEWVHFLLFFFVVLYIINVVSLIIFQLFITRRWKKYDELGYEYIRRRAIELKKKRKAMHPILRYLNFISWIKYMISTSFTNYGMLRKAVIVRTGLPDYFLFSIYMKYGLRAITIRLVNIHFSVYAIIIVIAWLNFIREKYIVQVVAGSVESNLIILCLGILLTILHAILYYLVSKLQRKTVNKESAYLKTNVPEGANETQGDMNNVDMDKVYTFLKTNENKKAKHLDKLAGEEHKQANFCGRPKVLIPLMQIAFLLSSFYIGIIIYYCIVVLDNKTGWYWWIVYGVVSLINAAIAPSILFSLVKSMYTGDMIDYHLLLKAWDKQYSRVKKDHLRFRADEDGIMLDNFKKEHEEYRTQVVNAGGHRSEDSDS